MLTVELIRDFLAAQGVEGFLVQPYRWTEKEDPSLKYLVIQASGRSVNLDFSVDDARLLFVAPIGYNRLNLNKEIEKIECIFLDNHFYDSIWFFKLIGKAHYYESQEGRPIFELNLKINRVE